MNNKYSYLIFGVIILLFFVSIQSIPPLLDDMMYEHFYPAVTYDGNAPHGLNADDYVRSIGDVYQSQYNHYLTKNGRALVHLIVQSFCGLWGKTIFNICSTFLFAIFLLLFSLVAIGEKRVAIYKCIAISFIFFLLIPEPTCFTDGIAFGVNYLWSSVASLSFLWLFQFKKLKSSIEQVLLYLLAFIAGWSHEGIVIALGAGLLFYVVKNWKSLEKYQIIGFAIFCIGAAFLIFAPSNFTRAEGMSDVDGDFWEWRKRIFRYSRGSYVFVAMLICLLVSHKDKVKTYLIDNLQWLLSWIAAFAFLLLIGALNDRSVFAMDLFAIILICRMIPYFKLIESYKDKLITLSGIVFVAGFISVTYYQVLASRQYRTLARELCMNPNNDCIVFVDKVDVPYLIDRFVCQYSFNVLWFEEWENKIYSWYYKKNTVLVVEEGEMNQTASLEDCFVEKYKVPGDNPFYQVGNYLYSEIALPENLVLTFRLGKYQAYDCISLAKKMVSAFRSAPVLQIVDVQTERISFDGKEYDRIYMYPLHTREIVAMDYNKK